MKEMRWVGANLDKVNFQEHGVATISITRNAKADDRRAKALLFLALHACVSFMVVTKMRFSMSSVLKKFFDIGIVR
jgi:hypothetical protein